MTIIIIYIYIYSIPFNITCLNKTGNEHINVKLRRVRVTIVVAESNNYYIYSVSVVLVIQHAKRMRLIMLPVASVTLLYFTHYLINGVFFGRKDFNKKFVFLFSLQLFSERLLIRRRIHWHIIIIL